MMTASNQASCLDAIAPLASLATLSYAPSLRGELSLLSHSENATYLLHNAQRRSVMRVHREAYHSYQEIASELLWLAALREEGLQVPCAIAGLDGELIQQVHLSGLGSRYVVLFDWIDGREPDQHSLNTSFCRLGAINAQLHRQARHWRKPQGFARMTWNHSSMLGPEGHWGRWQAAPYLDSAGQKLIGEVLVVLARQLAGYGQDERRFGLIHADLRLANLLVQGEQTRIIDFDDCGLGWYLHDLAAGLSFFEHHPDLPQWIDNWLEGYSQQLSLDAEDLAMVPTLIMQRRLQLLAWTGTHRGTPQVECLGHEWVEQTLGLCRRYLGDGLQGAMLHRGH
ncbi:phosphotransferase [Pseudomonas sp. Fl5BN2]|uniref:phosphotransferase enzyme family protein n=1 Tax=unclassified Pseudomonas TaxID=196821 RepID=UPI001376A8FC|nr:MULTISPECIES: phosphotransferase [unclassified Pseudomonas]NBF03063.1 phosphotransferase [Pseudomonas sp. Fl5BN2]NBF11295.1 phosphotransferase [Pseudomonas sp. Fl4BN1]